MIEILFVSLSNFIPSLLLQRKCSMRLVNIYSCVSTHKQYEV